MAIAVSLMLASSAAAQGPRVAPAWMAKPNTVPLAFSQRWVADDGSRPVPALTVAPEPRSYPLIGMVVGAGVGLAAGIYGDLTCGGVDDFLCGGYRFILPVLGAGAGLVVGAIAKPNRDGSVRGGGLHGQ